MLLRLFTPIKSPVLEHNCRNSRVKDALAGFVPEHILQKLLTGDPVREDEVGYLLMADLKDSTKLSRHYGADRWTEFVKALCPASEQVARKYGFYLQIVIWDAYYFTAEADSSEEYLNQAIMCAAELNQIYSEACFKTFREVLSGAVSMDRARFCLVHGDTTRDLKGSLTANWTIVGSAMASVSKLEQVCKSYEGIFFCTQGVLKSLLGSDWTLLPEKTRSSEDEVYRYQGKLSVEIRNQEEKLVA